jgi:Protein of unknown function (DUF2490)
LKNTFLRFALGLLIGSAIFAMQMDELELRPSATIRFSPIKKMKLSLTPELRFDYFTLDKFLLETEVKYSPLKYMDVGAAYKLVLNRRNNDPLEVIHRFDVYLEGEYEIDRFTPSLRLRYSNYDEDEGISNFLRYRVKVDYDIPKVKIDPYLGAELYHQLDDNTLYKIRYGIGADWRFAKKMSLGLAYKLDSYFDSGNVKHIVELGYTYKF